MRITVFGSGYVGLVTGVCFAEMGNDVICADVDREKIRLLQRGESPIYEPGLPELLESNLRDGRLRFTADAPAAVSGSTLIYIAVGTPSREDGRADLSHVLQVAEDIGRLMTDYCAIVIKSTVPAGTGKRVDEVVASALRKRGVKGEYDVISNPEFLREGSAIDDCLRPERVVVGCTSQRARELMQNLYEPFLKGGNPLILMDPVSAELTKYAANAMLATKISVMNELSRVCERVGANIERIRQGVGTDARIGKQFLYAGLGYGGSCFPKDVRALIKMGEACDENLEILRAVERVNARQKERFVHRVKAHFGCELKSKKVALWGLSFKPGTDDIREAPALFLIEQLVGAGASVVAYDPVAMENVARAFGEHPALSFAPGQYDALDGADALCVLTEWAQFREPDFKKMGRRMRDFVIFDGRNIYDVSRIPELKSCRYYSIGRGPTALTSGRGA